MLRTTNMISRKYWGQHMAGYAGKGTDADMTDLQPLQLCGLFVHGLRRIAQIC